MSLRGQLLLGLAVTLLAALVLSELLTPPRYRQAAAARRVGSLLAVAFDEASPPARSRLVSSWLPRGGGRRNSETETVHFDWQSPRKTSRILEQSLYPSSCR